MKDFTKYTGEYDKEFYDVLTEDGFVFTQVWPNAGFFRKGSVTLCSDEDNKGISIRESPIHPMELNMDDCMTKEAYLIATKDEESIAAYTLIREPVAKEERRRREEAEELRMEEERKTSQVMYISSHPPGYYNNIPYKAPVDKVKRKARRKAKKAARQSARQGRRKNKK